MAIQTMETRSRLRDSQVKQLPNPTRIKTEFATERSRFFKQSAEFLNRPDFLTKPQPDIRLNVEQGLAWYCFRQASDSFFTIKSVRPRVADGRRTRSAPARNRRLCCTDEFSPWGVRHRVRPIGQLHGLEYEACLTLQRDHFVPSY